VKSGESNNALVNCMLSIVKTRIILYKNISIDNSKKSINLGKYFSSTFYINTFLSKHASKFVRANG